MIWLAAAATFGSVFLATVALLWPREIRVKFHNVPAPPTLSEQIAKASKHIRLDG